MNDNEMRDMLVEYMGRGFLDNIIALFRQDPSVYRFLPDLLGQESLHVRLGAVALAEELVKGHRQELEASVPGLVALLSHENPTIRGDAASVLGTIGSPSALEALRGRLNDLHPGVREAAADAIREIGSTAGTALLVNKKGAAPGGDAPVR